MQPKTLNQFFYKTWKTTNFNPNPSPNSISLQPHNLKHKNFLTFIPSTCTLSKKITSKPKISSHKNQQFKNQNFNQKQRQPTILFQWKKRKNKRVNSKAFNMLKGWNLTFSIGEFGERKIVYFVSLFEEWECEIKACCCCTLLTHS